MTQITKIIITELYPKVEKSLKTNKSKWKKLMSDFFQARSASLYDIAPIDRIFFSKDDEDNFFRALNISKQEVTSILQKTYYYNMQGFNSDAATAKDEHSILALTVLRYFIMNKDKTNTELAMLYLSFSGKIYASSHFKFFRVVPDNYRHVMEYAINNMSNKYDIVKTGSVIGAIRNLDNTWLESYDSKFKSYTDEDVVYLIQQLKSRISSFIKNIASEFYKAFENKDYITYDSDNVSDSDDYHLADSDSLKLERTIDKAFNKLETSTTDFILCKRSIGNDSNVSVDELRAIIDSIMTNPENFSLVKELIRNICTFYFIEGKKKDVRSVEFIAFNVSPKPNSKDKLYLRNREILETLLLKNSDKYKIRSKRAATKISYNKVLLMYFVWFIAEANK